MNENIMTDVEKILIDGQTKLFAVNDAILKELSEIKIQTTKTNGRVNRLEEKHDECIINKPEFSDMLNDYRHPENKLKVFVYDSVKFFAATILAFIFFYITFRDFKL